MRLPLDHERTSMGNIVPMRRKDDPAPPMDADTIRSILEEMVQAGYAKRVGTRSGVDNGYALTDEGRRVGCCIVQMAVMDAARKEVDVSGTAELHAYLLGVTL